MSEGRIQVMGLEKRREMTTCTSGEGIEVPYTAVAFIFVYPPPESQATATVKVSPTTT
jgi:hypothetical protein